MGHLFSICMICIGTIKEESPMGHAGFISIYVILQVRAGDIYRNKNQPIIEDFSKIPTSNACHSHNGNGDNMDVTVATILRDERPNVHGRGIERREIEHVAPCGA